ncbi:uncharacterized protein LOC133903149 [Phragmites australis]|uniref:uncharacterized protein LOC133903149 n=1 Tax=Phragmites australis TaxID=29695 RepID=UPI002D76DA6C|nr:uncharacterized protein LOC133903149 [Phragmites australis]
MAAPASNGERPWADLPLEMVEAVVEHLDLFSTTRLAAVCTSWATAVAMIASLPFGMPCLLMTSEEDDAYGVRRDDYDEWTFQLMAFTRERVVSFPALISNEWWQWWVGAKDDWLATVDEHGYAQLLNPYTCHQIDLPDITSFPDFKIRDRFSRIVVCETPSDTGDDGYLVIAKDTTGLLAIARGGDENWTPLRDPWDHLFGYTDAVVHKGKVFAIDTSGSIYAWDIRDGACPEPENVKPPHVDRDEFTHHWRLAESADGRRLLIVCIYGKLVECRRFSTYYDHLEYLTFAAEGVRLYERDMDGAAGSDSDEGWSPVTSLGDHSLFLGANYPFFARVDQGSSDSSWHRLRPNCIYFTDNQLHRCKDLDEDVEVFDLGAEKYPYSSMKLFWSDRYYSYQTPIWFRPMLKNYDLE